MTRMLTRRQFIGEMAAAVALSFVPFPLLAAARKSGVKPFVKWAGGKSQLIEQLDALLPKDFAERENVTYVEPFVGGGAMLFHMLAKYPNITRAVINDLNEDLVTCYRVIKSNPEALIAALDAMQREYLAKADESARREMYLAKRERYNSREADEIERAALFIFLNKTAFNGLYRVNSKGGFNVPFNKAKRPPICDAETIRADSALLQKVEILCGDFEGAAAYHSRVAAASILDGGKRRRVAASTAPGRMPKTCGAGNRREYRNSAAPSGLDGFISSNRGLRSHLRGFAYPRLKYLPPLRGLIAANQ